MSKLGVVELRREEPSWSVSLRRMMYELKIGLIYLSDEV